MKSLLFVEQRSVGASSQRKYFFELYTHYQIVLVVFLLKNYMIYYEY